MYKLNSKSRKYVSEVVGIPFEDVLDMNSSDIDLEIERKIETKLKHRPSNIFKSSGRGTPFLFLWRLLGIEAINKKLSRIIK